MTRCKQGHVLADHDMVFAEGDCAVCMARRISELEERVSVERAESSRRLDELNRLNATTREQAETIERLRDGYRACCVYCGYRAARTAVGIADHACPARREPPGAPVTLLSATAVGPADSPGLTPFCSRCGPDAYREEGFLLCAKCRASHPSKGGSDQ